MLSTTILVLAAVIVMLAAFLLWAGLLHLGLRLVRTPYFTWRDVFVVTAMTYAWSIFVAVAFRFGFPQTDDALVYEGLLQMAIVCFGVMFLIHMKFGTGPLGTFVAWLPTNLCIPLILVFMLTVWRPFLFEYNSVPSNAMAPTLIGPHLQSDCSICDSTCVCEAIEGSRFLRTPRSRPMICENFHVAEQTDILQRVHEGDFFVTSKFLTPQRWDLAVFKSPQNTSEMWVKRLVGLPGEKIHIEDGVIHIDGLPLEYPEDLTGLKHTEIPMFPTRPHATKENPAQLADDEFFMLGDFSLQSLDSRYWSEGAPGHNPYAVPKSHLIGVATHIYWPWSRMRILDR